MTADLLQRVESAEDAMQRAGFAVGQGAAHANGTVARIEVPEVRLSDLLSRRAESLTSCARLGSCSWRSTWTGCAAAR